MENEGFKRRVENEDKNKIPVKLLFFILVITIVLSLVVSYIVVNYTGSVENDHSYDSGRIIVNVVDGESDELFTMAGKIVVEVVDSNESVDEKG